MTADPTQRVAQLEAELEALKLSTTRALEQSWQEVERVRNTFVMNDNHNNHNCNSNSQIDNCNASADSKPPSLTSTTTTATTTSHASWGEGNSSEDMAVMGAISVRQTTDDQSEMTWSTSTYLSDTLTSLGMTSWAQQREERKQAKVEKELMRQLEVLQEDKAKTIKELEVKLCQREAAIKTLESALQVKDDAIASLRDELEVLKAVNALGGSGTGTARRTSDRRVSERPPEREPRSHHPFTRAKSCDGDFFLNEESCEKQRSGGMKSGRRRSGNRRTFDDEDELTAPHGDLEESYGMLKGDTTMTLRDDSDVPKSTNTFGRLSDHRSSADRRVLEPRRLTTRTKSTDADLLFVDAHEKRRTLETALQMNEETVKMMKDELVSALSGNSSSQRRSSERSVPDRRSKERGIRQNTTRARSCDGDFLFNDSGERQRMTLTRPERQKSGNRRFFEDDDNSNASPTPRDERQKSGNRRFFEDDDNTNGSSTPRVERRKSGNRRIIDDDDRCASSPKPERRKSGNRRVFENDDHRTISPKQERRKSGNRRVFENEHVPVSPKPERRKSGNRRFFDDDNHSTASPKPESQMSGHRRFFTDDDNSTVPPKTRWSYGSDDDDDVDLFPVGQGRRDSMDVCIPGAY